MPNKIGACVTDIVSIAQGSGSLEERRGKAEFRIRDLLLDASLQVGNHFKTLQDLRDELGRAVNLHHGSIRAFLDKLVDFVDNRLGRS
jgi:hypothetical protein